MRYKYYVVCVIFFCMMSMNVQADQAEKIIRSERELPVSYDVDLLVVGGSTGAVAAASEAAGNGAKVLLVTQYPYLGENLVATMRIWPSENESQDDPLIQSIFHDPNPTRQICSQYLNYLNHNDKIPFKVISHTTLAPRHTPEHIVRLFDGRGTITTSQHLQFDEDAIIVLDLGKTQTIGELALLAFVREASTGFNIQNVEYFVSEDNENWKPIGKAIRTSADVPPDVQMEQDRLVPFVLTPENTLKARYLKLDIKKPGNMPRLLLSEIVILEKPLERSVVPVQENPRPRPMHIKKQLDQTLIDAKVDFLYGTYLTDMIYDSSQNVHGAVISNKAGRQVVWAKQVLQFPSTVATFAPESKTTAQVEFVVIGGPSVDVECGKSPDDPLRTASCTVLPTPYFSPRHSGPPRGATAPQPDIVTIEYPILLYSFHVAVPILADHEAKRKFFADLETRIRLATYTPGQAFTADELYFVSPDQTNMPLELSRNGNTVLPYETSAKESRKYGKLVAEQAKKSQAVSKSDLTLVPDIDIPLDASTAKGEVCEMLQGVRPSQPVKETFREHDSSLPVIAKYDVLVVGGGTSGSAAGIAASRKGAKTLVIESLHNLGGIGTSGAIAVYYYGNRVGFTKEVLDGKNIWRIEEKSHWWLSKLHDAGGDVWFGTLATGAIVDGRRVTGVVVVTPEGQGVVLADVVIDSTGNGDIAAVAGAKMMQINDEELAIQGAGLPPRNLGAGVTNTDFMYVDENDPTDAVHVFVYAKKKYRDAFDQGKILDTRERRRIVGEYTISVLDQINARTYPDTITRAFSNFDSHGYTIDPYMELEHPEKEGMYADIPYRCSIPVGLEGILVSGLATSAYRDAVPIIRMQPDLQNQGYSLGCIAAKAVQEGITSLREINIREIQQHLVEKGILAPNVLTEQDNHLTRLSELPQAVKNLTNNYQDVSFVLWYPKEAPPLVRQAFLEAKTFEEKCIYAKVAAAFGDPVGADVLIEKIKSYDDWDIGWNFRSAGQFGSATSPLDQWIMMLGRTRSTSGVPVIVEKMKRLNQKNDFSHHRACFLALEWIGDPAAAPAIAEQLVKPGMTGHAHDSLETAIKWNITHPGGTVSVQTRRDSLLELAGARALYRCGDHNGLGEAILKKYAADLRGHFARHAAEVLKTKPIRRTSISSQGGNHDYDVVVYGGTSAAVTTAVQVKRMGKSVVIVSPDKHLGGLSSGGLGFTDSGNVKTIGGVSREFYHRIYLEYQKPETWCWQKSNDYGNQGQGTRAILHDDKTMWIFEPHVAENVFDAWILEMQIPVVREARLDREHGVKKEGTRIVSITTLDGITCHGKMFIDTTYEGDLLAAAGVSYYVGRENNATYGEKWNGNQFGVFQHEHYFKKPVSPYKTPDDPTSGLLKYIDDSTEGINGDGDHRIQAYCYRMCLTRNPENRVPFPKPENYDPADYELLRRVFATGWRETFDKFDLIPNLKTDTNNHGPFSTDFIGMNYDYPEASYERRQEILKAHRDYQLGWLYYIANDSNVPNDVRSKMSEWGLAKDEFVDNDNWPHQIYVREARRMIGEYVMTEHECLGKKPPKPIGMGSYTIDSHNVRRLVTKEGNVQNEGDIGVGVKGPYSIDYGSITPKRSECTNLLVPVCVSSSHIAFGSIRMEPVFMLLGQSAATAAVMSIDNNVDVQNLDYEKLREQLINDGQRLEVVSKK